MRSPLACLLSLALVFAGCSQSATRVDPSPPALVAPKATPATAQPQVSATPAPSSQAMEPDCPPLSSPAFPRPVTDQVALGESPIVWGHRLAPFYEALASLERGLRRSHLRIGVHGDSNLTKDGLTGELRRAFSARFGDPGHGFVAPVRAWGWYIHEDVLQGNDAWWRVLAISSPRAPDLGYGVSGIAGEVRAKGAHTWFATAGERSQFGRTASKIGVFYRLQPGGGSFRIEIDKEPTALISTLASEKGVGHRLFDLDDGPHRIDIRTLSPEVVRLFGVYLERGEASVVVDSFGVGGVYFQALTLDDFTLTRSMEAVRGHDLVVYWLGANPHHNREYSRDVKLVIDERKKLDPRLPVLVVSPPDAVARMTEAASDPMSYALTERLAAAADVSGAAFWNMRKAQGGEGAAARFLQEGLATDRQHLSVAGSRLMARLLLHELWKDYQRYLAEHPRAGCDAR